MEWRSVLNIVAAGSGKSFLGVMSFLKWVTRPDMGQFRGVIVRRTMVQVTGPGGVAETGQEIFQDFGAQWKVKDSKFLFPNGASIVCKGCEMEKDKHNFQGWQVSAFLVDEAQQFEESQVVYFISRMRTAAPMKPVMMMTANPDYESFLRVWLEKAGYLDENGFPRPEMDGVKTWFVRQGNEMVWAKTREELIEKFGENCGPMSFVFLPATCHDNPVLLERDPSYVFKLKSLPRVERERLYSGCWYSKEESAGYFKREWVELVQHPSISAVKRVRAWDISATLPSDKNPSPDWSVGVLMSKDRHGIYTVEDVVRGRWRHGGVLQTILETARQDGDHVTVVIPRDPGASGIAYAASLVRELAENGFIAKTRPTNKSKVQRFGAFAALAEAGGIQIVDTNWTETYLDELERFDGSRNVKDD